MTSPRHRRAPPRPRGRPPLVDDAERVTVRIPRAHVERIREQGDVAAWVREAVRMRLGT